jgi:hypothetical protein
VTPVLTEEQVRVLIDMAREAEREQCAKACEESQAGDGRKESRSVTAQRCAAAIRNRKEPA